MRGTSLIGSIITPDDPFETYTPKILFHSHLPGAAAATAAATATASEPSHR